MLGTYYYINGTYVHSYQIAFQKLQRAIWYGESAFETIKIHEHTTEQFLPFHFERILTSAKLLSIEVNIEQLQHYCNKVLDQHSTGTLRILLFREPGGKYKPIHKQASFLFEVNTQPLQAPVSLNWNIHDVYIKEIGPLASIKSHCFPYIQAGLERSSEISLLINEQNEALEWEIGAFIWKKGTNWYTIPRGSGQVESVFVSAVKGGTVMLPQHSNLIEQSFNLSEIQSIDSLYLGNAILGLVPINILE